MFVVAAASGRTGRVVAETLLARGAPVRALVRNRDRAASWRHRGVDAVDIALDDAGALARAFAGATGVYTILPEDPTARDFHDHRRRIADAIAGAARSSGVPHVVLLSAALAVLAEGNGPAKDLHHAEHALRATGTHLTAIRASYFQENVAAALPLARSQGIYPSFLQSVDLAFPTNATREVGRLAASCLLDAPAASEVIDLVGPRYSVRDLAAKLGAAIGRTLSVVVIPPAEQVDTLTRTGMPRDFAEALVEMFACVSSGRVSLQGDRVVTGQTTLDDILPALIAGSP